MAFMGVMSTNPDFSYLIMKNPASGMIAKELRKGNLFGYFSNTIHSISDDPNGLSENEAPAIEYCLYFKDHENDVSYKEDRDQEFEYMDVSRYNSPLFVLDGIFNLLGSLAKEETHEKDVPGHFHSYRMNMVECNPNYLDIFKRTFKDFHMEFTPYPVLGSRVYNYNVRISTSKRTLKELTNLVALFAMFHALKCNHLEIREEQVDKYLKILLTMDMPYLIRYAFKIHLLRTPRLFKKHKAALEKSESQKIVLTPGNAYMERQRVVYKHFEDMKLCMREYSLLDVGCGEGSYIPYLSKRLAEEKTYHAIDINPEVLEDATRLIKRKQIENAVTYPSLEAFKEAGAENEDLNILCTEVIEHMEIDEARTLLKQLIELPKAQSLVVTTPNADFSKYYNDDHQEGAVDRHDGHKWEYNNTQFQQWVETKIKPYLKKYWDEFDFEYLHIGDIVNGECPSQGFIAKRNNYASIERHMNGDPTGWIEGALGTTDTTKEEVE